MSAETASKRKASAKDARPAKKAKASGNVKSNAANEKPLDAANAKKSRKRVADFIEDEAAPAVKPAEDSPKPKKKVKISKKIEVVEPTPAAISKTKSKSDNKTSKKEKNKSEDSEALVLAEQEDEIALPASDEEEDVAALLAGFSSDESEGDDVEEGVPLEKLPEAKLDKKAKKALEKANKSADDDTPGTLYVGRIPHGFYEPQMRAYFTQFGTIVNLRLARNKKSGASKHYAFIQFSSSEVADIVARTMNNYLMFGHILKVRVMPEEQVHPDLWKGANKRFKVLPRALIERKEMEKAKGRDYWKGKVQKENSKREKKRKAMEELGYEFNAPALKNVDDVPMKEVVNQKAKTDADVETAEQEQESPAPLKAIADAPAEVDDIQIEVEKVLKDSKVSKKEKVKVRASKKVKA